MSVSASSSALRVPVPAIDEREAVRGVAHGANRELDALDRLEAADREHVIAQRSARAAGPRAAAGGTAAAAATPLKRRARLAVVAAFANTRRHSRSISVSSVMRRSRSATSSGVCAEVAIGGAGELVRGAVLMDQPRDLVRMTHEVRRKLRRDHEIDRTSVALAQIDQTPGGRMRRESRASGTT